MEDSRMDLLGGLAQGISQGLSEVDKTVDYLEKVKQNRENMRLRLSQEQRMVNQDMRNQDLHGYKMQQMEMQIAQLRDAESKRRILDEVKGINSGTRQGFSKETMGTDLYKRILGDYNVRPANYFGQEVLASLGIDDPNDWMVADDGLGGFIKVAKGMFNQTLGYQDEINKYRKAEADILGAQAKSLRENMITQNQEVLQGLFGELALEFGALLQDPNVPADKKAQYAGWLEMLATFKQPTMSLKSNESYAQGEAKDLDLWTKQIKKGDFTNYERATKLVNTSFQNAMVQTAMAEGLKTLGVDSSKPFDKEKWEATEVGKANAYYLNAYRNTIANTAGATTVRKQMNETLGKGADLFLVDLGKQLKGREPGKEPERSMVQTVKKQLLSFMPDKYLADMKGANVDNEAFNVVAQLFINAYGNEKFGSALTEGEIERIDKAFGTDWKNTTTFLQGAMAQLRNSLARMEEAAASDPTYANITYGKEYINRQLALKNLESAYNQILDFSQWKAQNPRGTAKEYIAQRDARQQAQNVTVQTNAPASQPSPQAVDRKARLRAIANQSFGGQ